MKSFCDGLNEKTERKLIDKKIIIDRRVFWKLENLIAIGRIMEL